MKGLVIIRNGGEPLMIGSEECLLLAMFNYIDKAEFAYSDFYASVTEYATGDRYRYASEQLQHCIWEVEKAICLAKKYRREDILQERKPKRILELYFEHLNEMD